MPTLVTGATGFLGWHVANQLRDRGEDVRCLVRATSDTSRLGPLGVELAPGDLREPESLKSACAGCDTVYHVAADYRLWSKDPRELYRSNVDGTRALLEAASSATRIVYTSSVGVLGHHRDGTPADEHTPVTVHDMIGHYKRSKFLAEELVRERASAGQPIVIVNPSTPVGEQDVKPTPTARSSSISCAGRCRLRGYRLNLVDVRDVAAGHLLAAERGRLGERYILGHRDLTLAEILAMLATLTGRRAPTLRCPRRRLRGCLRRHAMERRGAASSAQHPGRRRADVAP